MRAGFEVNGGIEQQLIYGPGMLVGAAAMVAGTNWPLAIDVREDAIVFTLPARDFAALRVSHGPLASALFDMIGQQLTRDLRQISRGRGRLESQDIRMGVVA